jgi:hypothetical protein
VVADDESELRGNLNTQADDCPIPPPRDESCEKLRADQSLLNGLIKWNEAELNAIQKEIEAAEKVLLELNKLYLQAVNLLEHLEDP